MTGTIDECNYFLSLVHNYHQAMIDDDIAVIEAFLTDDFSAVHVSGQRLDKAAELRRLQRKSFNYHSFTDAGVVAFERNEKTARLVLRSFIDVTINNVRGKWRIEGTYVLNKTPATWKLHSFTATSYEK